MTRRFNDLRRVHDAVGPLDLIIFGLVALILAMLIVGVAAAMWPWPAHARDLGQWENTNPAVGLWFRSLMQPDNPNISCCGEADAYWADGVEIKDGKVYAIITDDRADEPLHRPHVPIGTRIEIPPHKYKWDRGNPTGHTVIFLSNTRNVYCYVQGGGV